MESVVKVWNAAQRFYKYNPGNSSDIKIVRIFSRICYQYFILLVSMAYLYVLHMEQIRHN